MIISKTSGWWFCLLSSTKRGTLQSGDYVVTRDPMTVWRTVSDADIRRYADHRCDVMADDFLDDSTGMTYSRGVGV